MLFNNERSRLISGSINNFANGSTCNFFFIFEYVFAFCILAVLDSM